MKSGSAVRLGDLVHAMGGQVWWPLQRGAPWPGDMPQGMPALHAERAAQALDAEVDRLATLAEGDVRSVGFLANPRYRSELANTACGVVLVRATDVAAVATGVSPPETAPQSVPIYWLVDDPYLSFARLTQWWRARQRTLASVEPHIHPSAVVHAQAQVHPSAHVGPLCVVERGATIGADTRLAARVTVGEECTVGARCIVHSGVVIGADGFGFAPHAGAWVKIEQLGAVRIGNDVEIGANTCIDRGALTDTVIEDGVKLDNLIQVGHNVHIGAHTAMAGCVGIAGSARIGAHCTVGGGAIILGHLTVGDGVHISAASVVTRSITQPGVYSGFFPIDDNAAWEKNAASLRQLHVLRDRVRALARRLEHLSPPAATD
jgi:UDP-3-O-[3-hydroxymyristoyl] glucosamine N-acyltransferase